MEAVTAKRALVLFSGGQDSTVCLGWALERFDEVETVGFGYGQRHAIELEMRPVLRAKMAALKPAWRARLGQDNVITIDALGQISDTALTSDREIEMTASGLPSTFVPGRNLIFLGFAGALAYRRGISDLVAGMCETDYSGYPDCRAAAIAAMREALVLGMDRPLDIHTPLMQIDKAGCFAMAQEIGGQAFLDLVVEDSHSCYHGERGVRHDWGYGCGECPACRLRADGFSRWKSEAAREHP
ncbi:MAG: 7-cyano-7-deazaguanine synthase QueC [Pseudolabrys sp.]|nr:7-cyano-7-deazaguanine synthase QueC [Pseudolabrys sp.]